MTVATRSQFQSTVQANVPLCREHFRLLLRLDAFPATAPGQFIQISCRDLQQDYSPQREFEWEPGRPLDVEGRELMSPLAFLRRPFSLAGRRDTEVGVELDIIHRVVGVGTDWLARLGLGDRVYILGPLGNTFRMPEVGEQAILVGGGVGIPPMLYLASALASRYEATGDESNGVAFCGALTRDLLPFTFDPAAPTPGADTVKPLRAIQEFARHGVDSVITTDDGTYGYRGFVTQALERYLDERGLVSGNRDETCASLTPEPSPLIYTCGPEPMMKRVAEIAAARNIPCQIAVERAMACGMGTCQSCVIRVRKPDPAKPPLAGQDWCYRLACTDGPVFAGADLLW